MSNFTLAIHRGRHALAGKLNIHALPSLTKHQQPRHITYRQPQRTVMQVCQPGLYRLAMKIKFKTAHIHAM